MYKKTEAKGQKIFELYQQGKNVLEIIRELEIPTSKKTVKKVLLSYGINYTEELAKKSGKAVEMYKAGKSMLDIQAELRLTWMTVRDALIKANVDQRSLSENGVLMHGYGLDTTVFDELNEQSLYWIGLLYADGHITCKKENSISVTLHVDDYELLEKFRLFLKTSRPIRKVTNSNCCKLTFGSARMSDRLKELGFDNRKSFTAKPHELLKDSRDFWRGVVDGDGCLYVCAGKRWWRRVVHLCGTLDTCIEFSDFLRKSGVSSDALPRKTKDAVYQISYESDKARQVTKILYESAEIYMKRKYQMYLNNFIENPLNLQNN